MDKKFNQDRKDTLKRQIIAIMNLSIVCCTVLYLFGQHFFATILLIVSLILSSIVQAANRREENGHTVIMRKEKMEHIESRLEEIEKCWKS